jgi:DNA-directed RNA polymerase specialized sigma24 family protein
VRAEQEALVPRARDEARRQWQRAPHALSLDELEAEALFGLAQAAARWPGYCLDRGHDPWAFNYFTVFCLARIRGAMLDSMRKADWVPRADRARARQLRDAAQSAPLSPAQAASAAGLSSAEASRVLALVAARPVSLDAEPVTVAAHDDVESSALVRGALRAAERTVRGLPPAARDLVLLRFVCGLDMPSAAAVAGVPLEEAASSLRASALVVREAVATAMGV